MKLTVPLATLGLCSALIATAAAAPKVYNGTINADSPKDDDDQRYQEFRFPVQEGQHLVVAMAAPEFDAYLAITGPDGQTYYQDDSGDLLTQADINGNPTTAFRSLDPYILLPKLGAGEMVVYARALGGQIPSNGKFKLYYAIIPEGEVLFEEQGVLDQNNPLTEGGAWYERFELELEAGQGVLVDLHGEEGFDTFLSVISPAGELHSNDDTGAANHSQVSIPVSIEGSYAVIVRGLYQGAGGKWTLRVETLGSIPEALGLKDGVVNEAPGQRGNNHPGGPLGVIIRGQNEIQGEVQFKPIEH